MVAPRNCVILYRDHVISVEARGRCWYSISAIVGGCLLRKTYHYYTKKKAINLFKEEIKNELFKQQFNIGTKS